MPRGELACTKETHLIFRNEHPENVNVPKMIFWAVCLANWDCVSFELMHDPDEYPSDPLAKDTERSLSSLTMPGGWVTPVSNWRAGRSELKFNVTYLAKPKKVHKRRGSVLLCLPQIVIDSTGRWGDWHADGEMLYMLDRDQQ